MANEITTTCCDCRSVEVSFEIPDNLTDEQIEEIREALEQEKSSGSVLLTLEQVEANKEFFAKYEIEEARKEGGYPFKFEVPSCAPCGSDGNYDPD